MAYDRCWILGDEFGCHSFEQYFQGRRSTDYNSCIKVHFDVSGYFNNNFSDNPSVISRMSNLVANAHSKRFDNNNRIWPLPKIVVIVPENALFAGFNNDLKGVMKQFARILNFIMTEHERNLASFKEHLPAQCLKDRYPHILWIQPPQHDNFPDSKLRFKFNKALEDCIKLHSHVSMLILKKVWNPQNEGLFLESCNRFSADGYTVYWEAIDRTVRYLDSIMLEKLDKAKKCNADQKDHFRWTNPKFNKDVIVSQKLLPPPPSHHRKIY